MYENIPAVATLHYLNGTDARVQQLALPADVTFASERLVTQPFAFL